MSALQSHKPVPNGTRVRVYNAPEHRCPPESDIGTRVQVGAFRAPPPQCAAHSCSQARQCISGWVWQVVDRDGDSCEAMNALHVCNAVTRVSYLLSRTLQVVDRDGDGARRQAEHVARHAGDAPTGRRPRRPGAPPGTPPLLHCGALPSFPLFSRIFHHAPDVQQPLQAPPPPPPPPPPPRPLAAAQPTGASKDCDAGVGC